MISEAAKTGMVTMARGRSGKWLDKKSRKGFRGYPVGTVAFYGPDNKRASKVAVAVLVAEDEEPVALERWFSDHDDVRANAAIADEIKDLLQRNGVRSVAMADRIIGCPHEEGVDYPEGEPCPQCPFWANRDRWAG